MPRITFTAIFQSLTSVIQRRVALGVNDGERAAAVALGRMGGKARAEGMTAKRRKEIAKAAKPRWQK
jgi:hypothetical protein